MITQAASNRVGIKDLLAPFDIDAPDIQVNSLVLDSREVAIHSAFIAIKGHDQDGRDFIPQAISLGAHAIIADAETQESHGIIEMRDHSVIVHFYGLGQSLSSIADHFYNHPSRELHVVSVTGTNGKTSTVQLIDQLSILEGTISATIGTLGAYCADACIPTINTTPDAITMQKLLRTFVSSGAKLVALEASSHALVQKRLADIETQVAVFTNLTHDHLDYHGSMEEYAKAKRLLLKQPGLQWVILNQNDAEHKNWLAELSDQQTAVMIGIDGTIDRTIKYCIVRDIQYLEQDTTFELDTSWGTCLIKTSLLGKFNVLNLLSAIATHLCLGMNFKQIAELTPNIKGVLGRMEVIENSNGVNFIVDYAHTPDALENSLQTARLHYKRRLWCVFGCGGERDKEKRPIMGAIAERLADQIVLTNDNSRSEEPMNIVNDIFAGCHEPEHIHVELDRKKAIRYAKKHAEPNDVVLVAGKGHEDYQIINNQRLEYNERHFIQQLVKENAQ
jgi:UDP-N-acetylmuramoyl-L-alanyl-D-glutamate--2,6-diaminopimelate ligase